MESPTAPTPPAEAGAATCETIAPVTDAAGAIDWDATRSKVEEAYRGFPADAETGAPAWQQAYRQIAAQEEERKILRRMEQIEAAGELPGTRLTDWGPAATDSPGYVTDAEAAKGQPCTRIALGDGGYLVYAAAGVIGALDAAQIKDLCVAGFVDEEPTPEQRTRLVAIVQAVPVCRVASQAKPPAQLHDAYFSCLGAELKKRGVSP